MQEVWTTKSEKSDRNATDERAKIPRGVLALSSSYRARDGAKPDTRSKLRLRRYLRELAVLNLEDIDLRGLQVTVVLKLHLAQRCGDVQSTDGRLDLGGF